MSEEEGGSGMGTVLVIVALVVVNLLSWVFNWGFWLY